MGDKEKNRQTPIQMNVELTSEPTVEVNNTVLTPVNWTAQSCKGL